MCNDLILEHLLERGSQDSNVITTDISSPCPDGLKKLLSGDSSKITDETFDPDELSTYKSIFSGKEYLKTHNWASNTSFFHGKYHLLHNETSAHLIQVFHTIADIYQKLHFNSCVLCRNNLFHGHIMHNKKLNDILIVFHAFEYPNDLVPIKSGQARDVEPDIATFDANKTGAFKWRNAIYSVNKNRVYLPDVSQEPYNSLLSKICPEAYTLDEKNCGELLFDINYFPQEGVPPFAA